MLESTHRDRHRETGTDRQIGREMQRYRAHRDRETERQAQIDR